MDSDEELVDSSDSEFVYYDEDYYCSDGSDGADDGDGDGNDYDFDSKEAEGSDEVVKRVKRYSVLNEADIRQRQEEDIASVSAILSISRDSACILLRHYKWDVGKLNDEWFANEEQVRKDVGLLESKVVIPEVQKLTCGICLEQFAPSVMTSAGCDHYYCRECWHGFISASINDGLGCLALRCPGPSCSAAVVQEMINELSTDENKEKYARFLYRSYVEDSRKTKWCPAPDCNFAVEFLEEGNYDVSCSCSYSFCWNCTEEAHRPVDCGTVAQWILKNSAESENMNWILANSKPCPKCKRPIEKNQGCMHMTCTPPCKFEFCWLCLGVWSDHGERTGGFYACNSYEAAKKEGVYDEAEKRREMAKNSIERYMHYYERWASNQTSRNKAIEDLKNMQNEKLAKLSENISEPETQLKFVIEAWQQIVECRRVLKWTYAYGYYIPEHEKAKREFFEYLQGEAESGLERLHQCAEKELQDYLPPNSPPEKDFSEFRVKLAGLTSVTRNYFENLVRALEAGLADVDSSNKQATSSQSSSSKKPETKSSKSRRKKKVARTNSSGSSEDEWWQCNHCTLINPGSAEVCEACGG